MYNVYAKCRHVLKEEDKLKKSKEKRKNYKKKQNRREPMQTENHNEKPHTEREKTHAQLQYWAGPVAPRQRRAGTSETIAPAQSSSPWNSHGPCSWVKSVVGPPLVYGP